MPEVHTVLGTGLPGEPAPTLMFHKWHRYDRLGGTFERKDTQHGYLAEVAQRIQSVCALKYDDWRKDFVRACEALGSEKEIQVVTLWRMVVGWGTNPAWETGMSLDHLYGFPYVPGSAVKGLLHRMAELELGKKVPPLPEEDPASPPAALAAAIDEALLIRTLFGSLHLRPDGDQPESALTRLEAWRKIARRRVGSEETTEAWKPTAADLETACADAPAGAMVTCFDAVPMAGSFSQQRPVVELDVLTPHTGDSPNPILFLVVREDVKLEVRFRLAGWPETMPRDDPERERLRGLRGHSREDVLARLRDWLTQGVVELGWGGKTSAGYGYLLDRDGQERGVKRYREPEQRAADSPGEGGQR